MGMDPADDSLDERPIPLRSLGPPDNVDAIEGLEIDTSKDVEPFQTAPSPELPSAKMVEEHRHLGVDYFYITAGGVKVRAELEYAGDG